MYQPHKRWRISIKINDLVPMLHISSLLLPKTTWWWWWWAWIKRENKKKLVYECKSCSMCMCHIKDNVTSRRRRGNFYALKCISLRSSIKNHKRNDDDNVCKVRKEFFALLSSTLETFYSLICSITQKEVNSI